MDIIIDIDGTICNELPAAKRCLAIPLPGARDSINKLYNEGNTIIFYSSRTWSEYEMTEDWLKKHGFKYNRLILGKPIGDLWIDDRALQYKEWNKTLKEIKHGLSRATK